MNPYSDFEDLLNDLSQRPVFHCYRCGKGIWSDDDVYLDFIERPFCSLDCFAKDNELDPESIESDDVLAQGGQVTNMYDVISEAYTNDDVEFLF